MSQIRIDYTTDLPTPDQIADEICEDARRNYGFFVHRGLRNLIARAIQDEREACADEVARVRRMGTCSHT